MKNYEIIRLLKLFLLVPKGQADLYVLVKGPCHSPSSFGICLCEIMLLMISTSSWHFGNRKLDSMSLSILISLFSKQAVLMSMKYPLSWPHTESVKEQS